METLFTPIIFGALAYIIPTFTLAYFWHLKWFHSLYKKWEYFGEPSPPFGLFSIAVQGTVLSVLYALAPIAHDSIIAALGTIGLLALLHWSIHVLAAMAKNGKTRNWYYFGFETLYLVIQFGIFAVLISAIVY